MHNLLVELFSCGNFYHIIKKTIKLLSDYFYVNVYLIKKIKYAESMLHETLNEIFTCTRKNKRKQNSAFIIGRECETAAKVSEELCEELHYNQMRRAWCLLLWSCLIGIPL